MEEKIPNTEEIIRIERTGNFRFKQVVSDFLIEVIRDSIVSAKKYVNGNLAVSNIRKLECSSFDFHSIAYGYGTFKEKIHFTEYYP